MSDIEILYYVEGALNPQFCLAYCNWVDDNDPDHALAYSEAFDLFAMYCMAAI